MVTYTDVYHMANSLDEAEWQQACIILLETDTAERRQWLELASNLRARGHYGPDTSIGKRLAAAPPSQWAIDYAASVRARVLAKLSLESATTTPTTAADTTTPPARSIRPQWLHHEREQLLLAYLDDQPLKQMALASSHNVRATYEKLRRDALPLQPRNMELAHALLSQLS